MEPEKILEMIMQPPTPPKVRRHKTSALYRCAPRGSAGRKATKWLDDNRVVAALLRNDSPLHRMKFMNRNDRQRAALALAS